MLGAAASGSAAGLNATIIDTHLRNAQLELYWTHDWAHLRRIDDDEIGAGQYLLDYPDLANADRVKYVSIYRGGVWGPPIKKGITPQMRTYRDNRGPPERWEPMEQLNFHPKADQVYPVQIYSIRELMRLTQDNDRFTIDDAPVTVVATATLKAHYRQPDAQIHIERSKTLINALKENSWGQNTFSPEDWREQEPEVRPQTISS